MKHDLEEEKKARRRLETSIKKSMKSNNLIWEETPTQAHYQGFKLDKYVQFIDMCSVVKTKLQ